MRRAADALEPFLLVGMVMGRVHASARVDEPVEFIEGPSCLFSCGPNDHAAAVSVFDYLTDMRDRRRSTPWHSHDTLLPSAQLCCYRWVVSNGVEESWITQCCWSGHTSRSSGARLSAAGLFPALANCQCGLPSLSRLACQVLLDLGHI